MAYLEWVHEQCESDGYYTIAYEVQGRCRGAPGFADATSCAGCSAIRTGGIWTDFHHFAPLSLGNKGAGFGRRSITLTMASYGPPSFCDGGRTT